MGSTAEETPTTEEIRRINLRLVEDGPYAWYAVLTRMWDGSGTWVDVRVFNDKVPAELVTEAIVRDGQSVEYHPPTPIDFVYPVLEATEEAQNLLRSRVTISPAPNPAFVLVETTHVVEVHETEEGQHGELGFGTAEAIGAVAAALHGGPDAMPAGCTVHPLGETRCTYVEGPKVPDRFVDVVFDGPPSAVAGRFVECERPDGSGVNAGQWIDRGDGFWALRIKLGQR